MAITDPTDIAGCVLWLDPSTLNAGHNDGDPVSSWADQVNSNDATSSGTDRPVFDDGSGFYHGNPSVRFTGNDDRLTIAPDASYRFGQLTYAFAVRLTDLETDSQWFFNKDNTNPATFGLRFKDGYFYLAYRLNGSEGTIRQEFSNGFAGEAWNTIVLMRNGTTTTLRVNGEVAGTESSATGSLDTDNDGGLTLGNHPDVDSGFSGNLGDFVIYDDPLTGTDLTDLEEWFLSRYALSPFEKQGTLLTTGIRDCAVRSASETGESADQLLVVTDAGDINHYTSTAGAHSWSSQGEIIDGTGLSIRGVDFLKVGSTWYVYVDDATTNGKTRLYTGSALNSLTEHGSSPVITGSAGNYVRIPGVIEDSGSWTMLLDVRTDAITGELGRLDRYTSSDGVSWTKDTVNSPVLSPTGNGFEGSDITGVSIHARASDYLVAYGGFNTDQLGNSISVYPHQIGICTSSDLVTLTRSEMNPVLPYGHTSGAFDARQLDRPHLWHDGSNYALYYSGDAANGNNQIGYATAASLPGDPASSVSPKLTLLGVG